MKKSLYYLTENSGEAHVVRLGTVYSSCACAGAEDAHVTGVTSEGLHCERRQRQKRNCEEECFWISAYKSFCHTSECVTNKEETKSSQQAHMSDCIKFHLRQTSECCYHKVHIQTVFFFITFQGERWLQIHYLKSELNPGCDSHASNRNGTHTYS